MTIGNIKFSQQPVLPLTSITSSTITPVVESSTNYQLTLGNIASYVTNSGNITATTVSTTGNITGSYFIGNGSQLTGLPALYGNTNVAAYLSSGAITGNIITTGNVTGGNITTAGLVSAGGNVQGSNLRTLGQIVSQGNITGGNVLTAGVVSATTNIISGNITGGLITATGNIIGGNLRTAGVVSATGNISSAGYFVGNGSQLTGLVVSSGSYIQSGNAFANVAAGNGSMWINSSQIGSYTQASLDGSAGNLLSITNGNSNARITLSSTVSGGAIVLVPGTGGNLTVGLTGGFEIGVGSRGSLGFGSIISAKQAVFDGTVTGANGSSYFEAGFNSKLKTPSSSSDTGVTGDICWDASYIYVCTSTNTWKRVALSTF